MWTTLFVYIFIFPLHRLANDMWGCKETGPCGHLPNLPSIYQVTEALTANVWLDVHLWCQKKQTTQEAFSSPFLKVDKPFHFAIPTMHDNMVNCIFILPFSKTHLHICIAFFPAAHIPEIAKQHISFSSDKISYISFCIYGCGVWDVI